MSENKNPDLHKWSEVRKKGKWNYIFKYGVLRFGLITWILILAYFWFFQPAELRLIFFLVTLVTFPLGGIVWGRWMWFYLEKLYARLPDSTKGSEE